MDTNNDAAMKARAPTSDAPRRTLGHLVRSLMSRRTSLRRLAKFRWFRESFIPSVRPGQVSSKGLAVAVVNGILGGHKLARR
jgi:hypothetical protein